MNDSQLGVAYQKSDRVGVAYQLSDRLSGCGLQIALKERQYFFLSTPSLPLFQVLVDILLACILNALIECVLRHKLFLGVF